METFLVIMLLVLCTIFFASSLCITMDNTNKTALCVNIFSGLLILVVLIEVLVDLLMIIVS